MTVMTDIDNAAALVRAKSDLRIVVAATHRPSFGIVPT